MFLYFCIIYIHPPCMFECVGAGHFWVMEEEHPPWGGAGFLEMIHDHFFISTPFDSYSRSMYLNSAGVHWPTGPERPLHFPNSSPNDR